MRGTITKGILIGILGIVSAGSLPAQSRTNNRVEAPTLSAHSALGSAVPAAQIQVNSSIAPAEGRNALVIDSSIDSFVRHDPEAVTFTFAFREATALRAIRIYSDTVDKATITLYNSENKIDSIDISQPYENVARNGAEGEFYVVRYNGAQPVTKVEIAVDFYSDADASKHRFYFADFLARSQEPSVQLLDGSEARGQISGSLRLATIYGLLQINADRIESITREGGVFVVRLSDGAVFRALPADTELELRGASSRKIAWSETLAVQGRAAAATTTPGQLYLITASGDTFAGQLTRIQGRAISAESLEVVNIDPARVDSLRPTADQPALAASVGGYGAVIFQSNASVELRAGGQTLRFRLREIQQLTKEAPARGSERTLENLTQS